MPPPRRKPSATAARAQQTLAFGPNSNKVTKPSLPTAGSGSSKKKNNNNKKPSPTSTPADADRLQKAVADISTPSPGPDDEGQEEGYPPPPERQLESPRALAIRGQSTAATAATGEDVKGEAEERAGRVSETQVKRYWKGKEDERIAPRVHQRGLSVDEKILRHFDLSSQYGVSVLVRFHSCSFWSTFFSSSFFLFFLWELRYATPFWFVKGKMLIAPREDSLVLECPA